MIHGSAFSDDHSATVSFITSLRLVGLKEKTLQTEHNGQDLSQTFWRCSRGKWRLAAGKWTQTGPTALNLAAGVWVHLFSSGSAE